MIESTYWISDLTYAIVLGLLFGYNKASHVLQTKSDRHYQLLVLWIIFFCIQDSLWGLAASNVFNSQKLLYCCTIVALLSTATTTFIWLNYVILFFGQQVKKPKLIRTFGIIVILAQVILIAINFNKPILFVIDSSNIYSREKYFFLLFIFQYAEYIIALFIAIIYASKIPKQDIHQHTAILSFALAPILSGFLQFLFPYVPFYSLGYFLGCFIINIYIITIEKEEKLLQESLIDKLTGFFNRKAYEEYFINNKQEVNTDSFIYLSMDVNSLKETNDTYGHMAGDELLCGASQCINQIFGRYGRLYRIGGDEFIAVLFLDVLSFRQLIKEFEELLSKWKGNFSSNLSISYGYVAKSLEKDKSLDEIILLADKRMYHNKNQYYLSKGIDRKIQKESLAVLCNSYSTILRINISLDNYTVIKLSNTDKTAQKKTNATLTKWLKQLAETTTVHPDNQKEFQQITDYKFVKQYFENNNESYKYHYKRLTNGQYKMTMIEIDKAPEYTDDNMLLYLYIKDIED